MQFFFRAAIHMDIYKKYFALELFKFYAVFLTPMNAVCAGDKGSQEMLGRRK